MWNNVICFYPSNTLWETEASDAIPAGTEHSPAIAASPEWRAVGAPSLQALKARWDGALGSLSWWGAALPIAGGGMG